MISSVMPVDLDVHLQRSDTVLRAGHFEVHIAKMVFVTQNVGQDRKPVAFLDETHRDTGNRCLKRNAGIHQRQ